MKAVMQKYLLLILLIIIGGALAGYLGTSSLVFRMQEGHWPWEEGIRIVCRLTGNDTYEIPHYYEGISTPIPISVFLGVGKSSEFYVDVDPGIPDESLIRIGIINRKANESKSQDFNLPLGEFIKASLAREYFEPGQVRTVEIVVGTSLPNVDPRRKRVSVLLEPWSHVVDMPNLSADEGEEIDCGVTVKNEGARGDFIVVYEIHRYKRGRRGSYFKEGRVGTDRKGRTLIQLDKNEELKLERQQFVFGDSGEYFLKTYVVKYQEYLMQNWHLWAEARERVLTYDEIVKQSTLDQIDLWRYSDGHQIRDIEIFQSR